MKKTAYYILGALVLVGVGAGIGYAGRGACATNAATETPDMAIANGKYTVWGECHPQGHKCDPKTGTCPNGTGIRTSTFTDSQNNVVREIMAWVPCYCGLTRMSDGVRAGVNVYDLFDMSGPRCYDFDFDCTEFRVVNDAGNLCTQSCQTLCHAALKNWSESKLNAQFKY